MVPRAYNSDLRLRKQAELRQRIAAAAATLHAQRGALATSYADIAAAAGVSVPTVYAHFPDQRALLEGCTGHVAALAPPLPVDEILAAPDLTRALAMLVPAVARRHAHFEPWAAWREDRVIDFLAELSAARRQQSSALLTRLFARHLGKGDHRELVAACETVLSFDFWHRLARGHGLSEPAVARVLDATLRALVVAPPAAPRSRRR